MPVRSDRINLKRLQQQGEFIHPLSVDEFDPIVACSNTNGSYHADADGHAQQGSYHADGLVQQAEGADHMDEDDVIL